MIETIAILIILKLTFRLGPTDLSCDKVGDTILGLEAKTGRLWLSTILITGVLLLVLLLFTRLDTNCNYHGAWYAKLATDPFAFESDNPVGYRILTPLISYLLGLKGKLIIITNLLITTTFLGLVYYYFRVYLSRAGDALFASLSVALTLIGTTSIHCGGYTDILTYLVIFLMWISRSRRWLFFLLLFVGLLNRESIAFLIPWFIFVRVSESDGMTREVVYTVLGIVAVGALYMGFRSWIGADREVQYSVAYYLQQIKGDPLRIFSLTWYYHAFGLYSVLRALWVVPILAIIFWWRERQLKNILQLLLLIIPAWAQLLIAQDTSRMMTLSFMVLFIAMIPLLKNDYLRFRSWAFYLLLANMIIPQVYTAGDTVEVWQTSGMYYIQTLF